MTKAIGQKNWLFSNTTNGAKRSAALYSIVATAQANGLDVEKYMTELFLQLAGTIICIYGFTELNKAEIEYKDMIHYVNEVLKFECEK